MYKYYLGVITYTVMFSKIRRLTFGNKTLSMGNGQLNTSTMLTILDSIKVVHWF